MSTFISPGDKLSLTIWYDDNNKVSYHMARQGSSGPVRHGGFLKTEIFDNSVIFEESNNIIVTDIKKEDLDKKIEKVRFHGLSIYDAEKVNCNCLLVIDIQSLYDKIEEQYYSDIKDKIERDFNKQHNYYVKYKEAIEKYKSVCKTLNKFKSSFDKVMQDLTDIVDKGR